MPDLEHDPGSPAEWLRYARSDFELARLAKSSAIMLELLCFHAQQTAEKALKAVLIGLGINFPKTHNIRVLLDLVQETLEIPLEVQDAARLTDYAVSMRYPGDAETVTDADYQEALDLAQRTLTWSEMQVQTLSHKG